VITRDRRPASVQATSIRLEAIEAGVARFADGQRCAVLELSGGEPGAGDDERAECWSPAWPRS
jgi:hypothetical protein